MAGPRERTDVGGEAAGGLFEKKPLLSAEQ